MADKGKEKKEEKTPRAGISIPSTAKGNDEEKPHSSGMPIPTSSRSTPTAVPRQRMDSDNSQESPRGGNYPITVASSPPKFVSMQDIMKAAHGMSNLALAHEIAVDSKFSIKTTKPDPNSLEGQVKNMMHQAFWDILQEKMNEDPPDLSHAVVLLAEVKENLLQLLLPQHVHVRQQIDEVLDMPLIHQKVEHGALDFTYYATFVIDLMAKLCAEARDEEVAGLRNITDVVPLYKELFDVLDLLKLDMANFTLQQMRPFIKQQSVQYERVKFDNFLQQQRDHNVDGLQCTRAWLGRSLSMLKKDLDDHASHSHVSNSNTSDGQAGQSSQVQASSSKCPEDQDLELKTVAPTAILNEAYLELLQWDFEHQIFPETVLLDETRFITLAQRVKWLSLVSSTLLVTYNTVGAPLTGIEGLKDTLKSQMEDIMAGVPENELGEALKNVSAQVCKEVQACLKKHGFPEMTDAKQTSLKQQIEALADPKHGVQKLMRTRIIDFIRSVFCVSKPQSLQVPAGLSAVSKELSDTCSAFMQLVNHNQKVFGVHYADIIKELIPTKH